MDDVPYDVAELNRFLSGEVLPPPDLVDLVAHLCGGDRNDLRQAYERARLASSADVLQPVGSPPARRPPEPLAAASDTENQPARYGTHRSRRPIRSRLIAAAVGIAAVTGVAAITTMTAVNVGTGDRPPAGNRARAHGGGPAPAATPRAVSTVAAPTHTGSPEPGPGTELVKNGSFTDSPWGWLASDKVDLAVDDHRLRIKVGSNSGDDHQDAMVLQNLPELRSGRTYDLKFVGVTSEDTSITVTLQHELEPDSPAMLRKTARLSSKKRTFSFSFTPKEATEPPHICFYVGGHRHGHTMWLDSVSLTERQ